MSLIARFLSSPYYLHPSAFITVCMVTSGADKIVKVWDVANNTPACLHSEDTKLVRVGLCAFVSALVIDSGLRGFRFRVCLLGEAHRNSDAHVLRRLLDQNLADRRYPFLTSAHARNPRTCMHTSRAPFTLWDSARTRLLLSRRAAARAS